MTKEKIIKLYKPNLNNLVADSDAKRNRIIDLEDELEALKQGQSLTTTDVVKTLPNKNAAICEGYNKASMQDYQNRNILRHKDKDDYYSGWMDCYDWISKGN